MNTYVEGYDAPPPVTPPPQQSAEEQTPTAPGAPAPESRTAPRFTPEERAFDGATLATVMNALADAPGQVLLQSPTAPTNNYRSEWSVVDLEQR